MNIIPCPHELCALDHHETATPIRHRRVVSDGEAAHSVTAIWAEDRSGAITTAVLVAYGDTTVTISQEHAEFWGRLVSHGGVWKSSIGSGTDDLGDDLLVAAELLHWAAPDDTEPPLLHSRRQEMVVRRAVSSYFEDEEVDA